MSKVEIKPTRDGGRKVIVTLTVQEIAHGASVTGDPLANAEIVARDTAATILSEQMQEDYR